MKTDPSRALLVILDGWGIGENPAVDAIACAETPCYDALIQSTANAQLVTYGEEVGLPEGQMGNSEVGHLNIGAGRVVYQELARINKAIKDDTFSKEKVLVDLFAFAKTKKGDGSARKLHFIGLVSDGGVHSHINHLLALCDAASAAGVEQSYIHAFTDGRDTAPHGGYKYLNRVSNHIQDLPVQLATITGRYYAMDRDNRWERVKVAYDALVKGTGERTEDPASLLKVRYANGQTDEFIEPIICTTPGGDFSGEIENGDAVVFFNFRTDRPRELTAALTQTISNEASEARKVLKPLDLYFATMTRYDEAFSGLHVIYTKSDLRNTLGEVLAKAGKRQLRIAETEKYPHVTFFFNGGREEAFEGESRIIIPSPKVATYDLQPEMSAPELLKKLVEHMEQELPEFICVNFANTDMVGHTGVWEAALKAANTVDTCLAQLLQVAKRCNYQSIIIADHGNSDILKNEDGSAHTAHTTNPVPVIYVGAKDYKLQNGNLGDVAPTILHMLGIDQPELMTGKTLLK